MVHESQNALVGTKVAGVEQNQTAVGYEEN